MAEHVVRLGVDVLIGKVLSLAAADLGSLGLNPNLKDTLLNLAETLENIQSLATDAESKADSSPAARRWLENVIAVASEADDLLDEYEHDVARLKAEIEAKKRSKVRKFFSSSNSFLVKCRVNRRILGCKSILERVQNESHALGLRPAEIVTMSAEELEQTRRVDPSAIVSRLILEMPEARSIVRFLIDFENEENLSFKVVEGMGGVGKTTLARVAYRDVEVVNHFDERIWVCVSQNFDVYRILIDMFNSLTRSRSLSEGSSERDGILSQLLEKLKGKKYLLVLDDVWNTDIGLWHSLGECLLKIGGSRGSKVLVTTRSPMVALIVNRRYVPFTAEVKDEAYSWDLLRQIASAEGGVTWDDQMEKLGKILMGRCAGHPLLLRLIAGLINSTKNMQDLWKIADELREPEDVRGIEVIVGLCFNHLPSWSLKRCFAYCSIFPPDSVMGRDELIQLWMAQGFLYPPKGSALKMEDVGSKYLDILVRCSFLQNAEEDEFENRPFYVMHDILNDFVSGISRGYCSIVDNNMFSNRELDAVHLSMMNPTIEMSATLGKRFKMLRTLRLENTGVDNSTLEEILAYTMCLRVLIVVDELVNELPNSIGNLKHLRYLDISRTRIVRLIDSTTRLFNLQTLRLYDLQELPKKFENLVNLHHFYVENFKDNLEKLGLLPDRFQEMIRRSSFKPTFKQHLVKEYPIDRLGQADIFASLKIYGLENVRIGEGASRANLSSMSKMDSLSLHWNARRGNYYDEDVLEGLEPDSNIKDLTIENFKGSKFPSWMVALCNLVKIELEGCCCCEQIPQLGHLHSLKIIRMVGMDNVKSIGTEFYGVHGIGSRPWSSLSTTVFFPALRQLTLKGMTSLEEWSEDETFLQSYSTAKVFPSLEKLEIEDCPKLAGLPNTINRGCEYLRRLDVVLCEKLDHLPEVLGRLKFLEDLEMRGLPSLSLLSIGFSSKLISLAIGGFSSASKDNGDVQHASAFASSSGPAPSSASASASVSSSTSTSASASTSTSASTCASASASISSSSPAPAPSPAPASASTSASVKSLYFRGGHGKLESLPEELKQLSNLRYLTIWGYGGLKALPEWLGDFKALQILKLELCGNLKYLPSSQSLQKLTNLAEVNICFCPLLEERCTKGSRPEWHKISHIPTIKMSYETIKSPIQSESYNLIL